MQNEQIVLIPPAEEQAWPSFHVVGGLAKAFLEHLKANGIQVQLPPEDIGSLGADDKSIIEIEVEEEHSEAELEKVLSDFLASHKTSNS